jgi:acetyl-CoA carboxylase biotin carboxyl carrier protein
MALTQDDIIAILKMVDQAPVGRLSVQTGELKLEVVKGAPGSTVPVAGAFASNVSAPAAAPVVASAPALAAPAPASTAVSGGGPTIKAPLLGIFYRQPEPGAPPYVEEGAIVEEDTTVALIEVMKLFNPVKAGMRGRIRRICVESGALVEFQQDLFEIDPV